MQWINIGNKLYFNVANICSVLLNNNGEVHVFMVNSEEPIVLKAKYAEEFIRQFREIIK